MDYVHLILLIFIKIVNTSHELNEHPEGITELLDKLITETENRNFTDNVTELFGESDKESPNKSFKNLNDSNIVYLKTPLIPNSEDVLDKVRSIENTRRHLNSDFNYDTETVIEEHSTRSENVGDFILEKEVTIDFSEDPGAPSNFTDEQLAFINPLGRRGLNDESVNLISNRMFKYVPRIGLDVERSNKSLEVDKKAIESDLDKILYDFNILKGWDNSSENKSSTNLKKLLIQNQSNESKHVQKLKNSKLKKDLSILDNNFLEAFNTITTANESSKSGDTFNDSSPNLEDPLANNQYGYTAPPLNHPPSFLDFSHPPPHHQYNQPPNPHHNYPTPNHNHNNPISNLHHNYPTLNQPHNHPTPNNQNNHLLPGHRYSHLHNNHPKKSNENKSGEADLNKLIGDTHVIDGWYKNKIIHSNMAKLSENKTTATHKAIPTYNPNLNTRPVINVFHHNLRYPIKRYRLPLRPTLFPANFNPYYTIPQEKKCCTHGICVPCANINNLMSILPAERLMTGFVYNPINPMYYQRYI